ncbi:MAG: AAA family ATPase [Acidobacteriota bacterium]
MEPARLLSRAMASSRAARLVESVSQTRSEAVVIFINGSFGIGKTTVARNLRARLPGSIVFDPEPVGLALKFLSRWIPLRGRHTDDFQDLVLWRRACVWGVRLSRRLRTTVIVPMTYSDVSYLREVVTGVETGEPRVLHLCLTAPWSVVEQRIRARAAALGVAPSSWTLRRAAECCVAHQSPEFALHVPTGSRTPEEVASAVMALARALPNAPLQPTSGAGTTIRFKTTVNAARG